MKSKIKQLVQHMPIVEELITNVHLKRKFKTEIDLLKNKSKSNSNCQSIIHFSVNKAATQYIKGILRKISKESGLTPVGIHEYAFWVKMPYLDHLSFEEMNQYKHLFKIKGYLYSVFGGMIKNIDDLERYKIILSVRDPRDILVSKYYSVAFSHAIPPITSGKRFEFLKHREMVQGMDIDTYVLQESKSIFSVFNDYKIHLLEKYDHVGLVEYDDMIHNYEQWLDNLISKCGINVSTALRNELRSDFQQTKKQKENKNDHIRKGISGDYKEKLNPKTIDILNSRYEELLDYYGYPI